MSGTSPRTVRFGVFEVDLHAGELRKQGLRLRLQEQPFQVLAALLENPGEVVGREDLVRRLWPDGTVVDFERGLNAAVTRLRQALSDSAETPRYVETVARRGYRFVGAVENIVRVAVAPVATPIPPNPASAVGRRLLALIAGVSALLTIASAWIYLRPGARTFVQAPDLVRVSPDDSYSYGAPAISPDGKFVAFISDRSGNRELWLQQVAGGEPIQLTHSRDSVERAEFFPDGARILYQTVSLDGRANGIWIVATLGGEPVLIKKGWIYKGRLSPDGSQVAYFEAGFGERLMLISSRGGDARELSTWRGAQGRITLPGGTWTPDGKYFLCLGSSRRDAPTVDEWEWFALPVNGGSAHAMGAGYALRSAGLKITAPGPVLGDRLLFGGGRGNRQNVWEISFSRDSWRVNGSPRQLTFGTLTELPSTMNAAGWLTLEVARNSSDLFLASPIGASSATIRRLTHDGRIKTLWSVGGDSGTAYFQVDDTGSQGALVYGGYGLNLETGKQTLVASGIPFGTKTAVSWDGRRIVYSIPHDNTYTVRIAGPNEVPEQGRLLCKACGRALRFSADGRYVIYQREATVQTDPKRKLTASLMEVDAGKEQPWLEHPSDSIVSVSTFADNLAWAIVRVSSPGTQRAKAVYIVPWREEPVRFTEWIEVQQLQDTDNHSASGNVIEFIKNGQLMEIRFDLATRSISAPNPVKLVEPFEPALRPNSWTLRDAGLVFTRPETASSVWLMKMPQ